MILYTILVKTRDAEVKQNVKREANGNVRALNTQFRSVGLNRCSTGSKNYTKWQLWKIHFIHVS